MKTKSLRRKRGRPPIPAARRLTEQLTFRVSKRQFKTLAQFAKKRDMSAHECARELFAVALAEQIAS